VCIVLGASKSCLFGEPGRGADIMSPACAPEGWLGAKHYCWGHGHGWRLYLSMPMVIWPRGFQPRRDLSQRESNPQLSVGYLSSLDLDLNYSTRLSIMAAAKLILAVGSLEISVPTRQANIHIQSGEDGDDGKDVVCREMSTWAEGFPPTRTRKHTYLHHAAGWASPWVSA
jgi:hypothetical protein